MMEWRQSFLGGATPSEADVTAEAATGKAYLHTQKDVNGRPVIIIRARRHLTGETQFHRGNSALRDDSHGSFGRSTLNRPNGCKGTTLQ